jgi:hypothetical protein
MRDNTEMDLKVEWEIWIGFVWLRVGTKGQVSACCEHGDGPLGSIKCWEFRDQLGTC